MATQYLKLQWSNTCNLGRIYYDGDFRNMLYFDAEVGKPEYEYEVEEEYNTDGVLTATYQRLVKIYKFQVLVPEYVVDALEAMQLHDTISLTLINNGYISTITNVKVDAEWEDMTNECMALCTISFQQGDQVVKGACCET